MGGSMNKRVGFLAVLLIALLAGASVGQAQNLLWFPESVVYDAAHERYLVSNYLTGDIVSIDLQGNQQYFVQAQCCQNGLHIVGNTVYAACQDQGVKAFDLDTGQLVDHIVINGASTLNDITSDTSGNIYVSDLNAHRIIKIRLSDKNYSIFVSSDITFPNGIYFQERYNRILLVSLKNYSPIQSISLDDSSVVSLANTGLHTLDGITEDNEGNIYFSSWNTRAIYRYDSTFSGQPQLFYENDGGPADIFYDKFNCVLAVPLMDSNAVDFISTPTGMAEEEYIPVPGVVEIGSVYPNPFNDRATVKFVLSNSADVDLEVFDLNGRLVTALARGYYESGEHLVDFDGCGLSSGVYFVRLRVGNSASTRKTVLLK